MRVQILGSGAGGGLPQWNCRCPNCRAARAGTARPRSQSSIAVGAPNGTWFLLNVSADVREQLCATPALWPAGAGDRCSPIAGCLLTDAEIDHASGLLQLREGSRFSIYSTKTVHRWLTGAFPIAMVLNRYADRPWREVEPDHPIELKGPDDEPTGLDVILYAVGRHVPKYVPEGTAGEASGAVVAVRLEDRQSGGVLFYAPGIEALTDMLRGAASDADVMLADGTFWADDEPRRAGITERTAREMGHVPISGPAGTLAWLAELPARMKRYIHINNTNPILDEQSVEHEMVKAAGVLPAKDGDHFDL